MKIQLERMTTFTRGTRRVPIEKHVTRYRHNVIPLNRRRKSIIRERYLVFLLSRGIKNGY